MKRAILLLWLGGATGFGAVIGDESLVTVPARANYGLTVNVRPGNGEVCAWNPPVFSWFYTTNIVADSTFDNEVRTFQFQVSSTNNTWDDSVLNRRVTNNFFNALAPFTNANGSIYTAALFWRVLYVGTNGLTNFVGPTNMFTVASTATNWPRSNLTSDAYYAAKTNHPIVIFTNATVRGAMLTFLPTNDAVSWYYLTNYAAAGTNSAWWVSTTAWDTNSTLVAGEIAFTGSVLLMAAMNTNSSPWTNRLVDNYQRFVTWFNGRYEMFTDNLDYPLTQRLLALGYDWLHSEMSALQRSNALTAIERTCLFVEQGQGFFKSEHQYVSTNDYTFSYDKPETTPWFSAAKQGSSHPSVNWQSLAIIPLVSFGESAAARRLLELYLNYFIGHGSPYAAFGAHTWGRGYAYANFGQVDFHGTLMFYHQAFSDVGLTNIHVARFGDWYGRVLPPGYLDVHGEFSDTGLGARYSQFAVIGRNLTRFSRSGIDQLSHDNHMAMLGLGGTLFSYWDELANGYNFWPLPVPATNSSAALFPEDGRVIVSSQPANDIDAFTNGVGVVFEARPYGPEGNHSINSDLSVEMWAYGAKVTDNGGYGLAAYGHLPWASATLTVNGVGQTFPSVGKYQTAPTYGGIIAFTNNAEFSFFAGDMTGAYTNGLSSVSNRVNKVRRNVLFNRKKYIVVFDQIEGSLPNTNQMVHHVLSASITNLSASGFRYSSTNYTGQVVSNHLFVATADCTLSNMTGTNVLRNPVTGVWTSDSSDPNRRSSAEWFHTTGTNFLWVLYPVAPGGSQPTFTRISDYAVTVTNGNEGDTILFQLTNNVLGMDVVLNSVTLSQVSRITIGTIRSGGTQ